MATRALLHLSRSVLTLIGCWAGSAPQQVCQRWQERAEAYAGPIAWGKEDGVSKPLPTSHTVPLGLAGILLGPQTSEGC